MSEHSDQNSSAAHQTLHGVLAEYIRRLEAGESVNIESYCAAYPHFADGLRSYAEGQGLLDALFDPASSDSGNDQSAETIRPGAAQRTDFSPQAEFGRYRLIRELGNGAMGTVFLAEDKQLGRQVALKIPKATGTENAEFLKRFTREAQAAARLEHANLCRVYDAGDVKGVPFISMEYIDGPPLSQCVGTPEFQDQRRVAETVLAVASGLQFAHERGVLHRDVKSANVLMKNGTTPCVTDFGLARMDETYESRLTHQGAILGTPAYMAPEQIEARIDEIGPSSDVYALGVVLYELLTGRTPFQGGILKILSQAINDQPPPLQQIRSDVDPQLAALCLRMLVKDPKRRLQSMQMVVDQLQRWLHEHGADNHAQDAKRRQSLAKLESMKSKAQELLQLNQSAQAVTILEKMQRINHPDAAEYVAWARENLEKTRKLSELTKAIPSLLATARKCLDKYDYAQAAQLLQEIPANIRNDEVNDLLNEVLSLQEESDQLLLALQECVRTRRLQGIEENLKRFRQLRPGNRFAKELEQSLQTYSKRPYKQRQYRFDARGTLQPLLEENLWKSWGIPAALCFAGVIVVMTLFIKIYLKDGDRTLAVEVDKEWLAQQGGELTLAADGKEHTISAAGMEVKVTFGECEFSVKHGETIVHDPKTFSIAKEGRQVLRITAEGMSLSSADATAIPPVVVEPTIPTVVVDAPRTPLPDGPAGLAKTLEGHSGFVHGLEWTPDGTKLVSMSGVIGGTMKTWDLVSGDVLKEIPVGNTYAFAIHPDGKKFGMCSFSSHQSGIFDLATGEKLINLTWTTKPPLSIAYSGDGKYLAMHHRDGRGILVHTMMEGNKVPIVSTLPGSPAKTSTAVAFLPDNEHLLASSDDVSYGTRMYHVPTGREVRAFGRQSSTTATWLAVHPGGKDFVTTTGLSHFAISQPELVRSLGTSDEKPIFSADGRHLICVNPKNATIVVRGFPRGNVVWQAESKLSEPSAIAISRDGRFIAIANRLPPIEIWRLPADVQPKLSSSGSSPLMSLEGLKLSAKTRFTGTYRQQSPVATHEIVVSLSEQQGSVWHGEFESLRAIPQSGTGEIATGFKYACELDVKSPSSATLRMTAIKSNESGNPIRDTTANWVEELTWDGISLSNGPIKLTPQ